MSEPVFSDTTEALWRSLPEVHRREDAAQVAPPARAALLAAINEIRNPVRVASRTSWGLSGGNTAIAAATAPDGGPAIVATKTAVGSSIGGYTDLDYPLQPGEVFFLSYECMNPPDSANPRVMVPYFRDGATVTYGTQFVDVLDGVTSYAIPDDGVWRRVTFPLRVQAGRVLNRVYVLDNSSAIPTTERLYWRHAILARGPVVPYFDGSTSGVGGWGAEKWSWEGTPDASRSIQEGSDAWDSGYPMKRYVSAVSDQVGEVEDLVKRLDYEPPDSVEYPGQATSDLADPMAADAAWLPWLAQLLGVRAATTLTPDQQRTAISSAVSGFRAGTRAALGAAAQTVLTGSRAVAVYDHSIAKPKDGGGEWDVLLVTRASETPVTSAQLLAAVAAADGKPAGVKLRHATFDSTWSAIEAARPTWTSWDSTTWTGLEETGL